MSMVTVAADPTARAIQEAQKHLDNRDPNRAIAVYQQLLNRDPKNEEAVIRISCIFLNHKEYSNAIKSLKYYLNITQNKHIAYYNLGIAYQKLRKEEDAIDALLAAIKHNAKYVLSWPSLYSLMVRKQRLQEMESLTNQYLQVHPKIGELHWMLAKLRLDEKQYEQAKKHFDDADKNKICKELRSSFFSDYAMVLTKLKQYDQAMEYHQRAQTMLSQSATAKAVDSTHDKKIIKFSYHGFDSNSVSQWQNTAVSCKDDPIFVMGFPRSGTTLMEQILFAHPKLVVTDELQVLRNQINQLDVLLKRPLEYPQGLDSLSREEIQIYRDAYFKNMADELSNYERHYRIVDKVPMSIKYLGFIKRFFPQSPILMMIRDPRDVCLSCFFQHFAPNSSTVNFYSLKQTFEYYAEIMNLYLFFKSRLPLKLMEVKYEDMCDDFETYAKTIVKHIGEDWQDSIIDFYKPKYKRYIATPSFDAVAQPVNKKAVGNWQNYAKYIEPIEYIIEPFLKEFGYPSSKELKQL